MHAVAALLYIAISLGHIYLGTIGMRGRLPARCARLRRRDLGARSTTSTGTTRCKIGPGAPARAGAVPAGAPHMKEKS